MKTWFSPLDHPPTWFLDPRLQLFHRGVLLSNVLAKTTIIFFPFFFDARCPPSLRLTSTYYLLPTWLYQVWGFH
ncbi:hypothetical protein ES332_A13G178800v1 [Gossypium tomentosum]|uniref:Uncharacterized protein n=1 Tax=Gossypium tomentosum TaxID=34277 RepID=A0A5D2MLP0_GOSTO|nr:hypothetical protein ES332_A13G178800v1 [Gossypium tomentosum]